MEMSTEKNLTPAEKSLLIQIKTERDKIKYEKEAKEKEQRLISQSVYVSNYVNVPRASPAEPKIAPKSEPRLPKAQFTADIPITSEPIYQESSLDEQEVEPTANMISSAPILKRKIVSIEDEIQASEQDISKFFSQIGIISEEPWASSASSYNKSFTLPNFSFQRNNSIGLQLTIPSQKQWALNITPANDFYLTDIYFHYNFRYDKRRIALSDRQGTWGDVLLPFLPGFVQYQTPNQQLTLKIIIREDGFFVFTEKLFVSFFKHRRMIPENRDLQLIFNARDDNGHLMDVIINRIWWGHQEINNLPPPALRSIEEENGKTYETVVNPIPPRTIIANGFPKEDNLQALHALEFFLLDLFESEPIKIAPEKVSFIPGQGIAFIRMNSPDQVPQILAIMPSIQTDFQDNEYNITFTRMA